MAGKSQSSQEGEQPEHTRRGFAAMDEQMQRSIAGQGGRRAHEQGTAHEFRADEARIAGQKGGKTVSRNRLHMAEIGRRGGAAVKAKYGLQYYRTIGKKGGETASSNRTPESEQSGTNDDIEN